MRKILMPVGVALSLCAAPCAGADAPVLTLSCGGVVKNFLVSDSVPEKITRMGVLVNLSERTVSGFAHPARITEMSDASVEFSGRFEGDWYIKGTVDRITGSIGATETITNAKGIMIFGESWDLTCSPTKRVF